jgi:hypothetical protein
MQALLEKLTVNQSPNREDFHHIMVHEVTQCTDTVSLILFSALNIYVMQAVSDLFRSGLPTEAMCNELHISPKCYVPIHPTFIELSDKCNICICHSEDPHHDVFLES